MAVVYRGHNGRRETRYVREEHSERISPLVILQARFQQKQLQEKEEKLVKLFQEQQERALKSVGSRSHSGGSSVSSSSSVGVGKVRHMFQSRRENSEPRLGASITGRDKSHPLEPLSKNHHRSTSPSWDTYHHLRTLSLDRRDHNHNDLDLHDNHNRRTVGVRRTDSRSRTLKSTPRWEEATYGQSFRLVDDYSGSRCQKVDNEYEDSLVRAGKRQSYENVRKGRVRETLQKLASGGLEDLHNSSMEGRYKSYVSQTTFARKAHLGNGNLTGRTGIAPRQTTEVKESSSSGYLNGSSPVRKIRKPTPVPLSVAPPQHLLQKEMRKTTRVETIKEVPPSVTSPKTTSTRTQSLTGTIHKPPPTPGRTLPSSRVPPTKSTSTPAGRSTGAPPSDLVDCRICGRHFAADRVSKHEEVCQKSTKNKRKPFDALQQRVKGTEVEQYIRKSTKASRPQQDKVAKPQSNWRKKHEEFINNIRAAKEVSAHLKKGGKLSDLPPPPPSDYSDYVPCPHCGRKFSSSAAERHIPKCANIINNKPKANLHKSGGLKQSSKLLHPASTSVRGRK